MVNSEAFVVHEEIWPSGPEGFASLVARHEPTVFRGACRGWLPGGIDSGDAVLQWLSTLIGQKTLPVHVGLPEDRGFLGSADVRGRNVATTLSGHRSFREVVPEMVAEALNPTGHAVYVQSVALPEIIPYMQLPLDGCPVVAGQWRTWIGSGSHHVGLHIDGQENFYCLLAGRKRFQLLPFEALTDLYIGPFDGGPYGPPCSIVDPVAPDLLRFPKYRRALERSTHVELAVGDVLYLPCHWWHAVESVGLNVACNYWWKDIGDYALLDAHSTFLRGLAFLRPLPRHWRGYWRTMFEVFAAFDREGPYLHLPSEDQGLFGTPTPERLRALLDGIAAEEGDRRSRTVADADLLAKKYRLAPDTFMVPKSANAVLIRGRQRANEESVSLTLIPFLASFASGCLASEAMVNASVTESDAKDVVRRMLSRGLLVLDE